MAQPDGIDQPEVFISYSRLERGKASDAGWRERRIALDLVERLDKAVEAASYRVWRDKVSIRPGDDFEKRIDSALLTCAGAVVVLDPDTLERSPWVRWESSILAWRRRIGGDLRIVPVLLGVTPDRFDACGYGPSRLDYTHAYELAPDGLDPGSASYQDELDAHARAVIEALGVLHGDSGEVSKWVKRIAACLPSDTDSWCDTLRERLAEGDRLLLSAHPARVVGRELLVADRPRLKLILTGFQGVPGGDRPTLKLNLVPVWVPADAATAIAEAKERPEGKRIVAVSAVEPETGTAAVRRAVPGAAPYQRLQFSLADIRPADAVARLIDAIEDKWPGSADEDARTLGGCFVVIGGAPGRAGELSGIAAALADRHPALTYVLMVGGDPPGADLRVVLAPDPDATARSFPRLLDQLLEVA